MARKYSFDSILVRLKDANGQSRSHTQRQFRFHTGSIKSLAMQFAVTGQKRFDSILVRLKAISSSSTPKLLTISFRFHTGSIKRIRCNPCRFDENSFDSILVRLKGSPPNAQNTGKAVSIPYWFD